MSLISLDILSVGQVNNLSKIKNQNVFWYTIAEKSMPSQVIFSGGQGRSALHLSVVQVWMVLCGAKFFATCFMMKLWHKLHIKKLSYMYPAIHVF